MSRYPGQDGIGRVSTKGEPLSITMFYQLDLDDFVYVVNLAPACIRMMSSG